MFCNNCGTEIKENSKFCNKCGAVVDAEIPVGEVAKNLRKHVLIVLSILLPVAVAGILAASYFLNQQNDGMKDSNVQEDSSVQEFAPMVEISDEEEVAEIVKESIEETEEDIFHRYIQQQLVSEYGLASLERREGICTVEGGENWLSLAGILATHIDDFDQNGTKELLVLYSKDSDTGDWTSFSHNNNFWAAVYVIDDGTPVKADEIRIDSMDVRGDWEEFSTVYFPTNGYYLGRELLVSSVVVDGHTYFLFEYDFGYPAFADGYFWCYFALDFNNGKMNNAFTISGSSTSYTILNGYDFSDNELTAGEMLYADMGFFNEFGYVGSYDDISTAMISFFGRHGITVDFPQNEYFASDIVSKNADAQKILSCSNEIVSRGSEWDDPITVAFEGTDFTNMRDFVKYTDRQVVEEVNTRGNSVGNIVNMGYAAIQDNKIYYRNESSGGKLYSANADGTDKCMLSDDAVAFINIVGDRVYYRNESDEGKLYSIKTDGTDRQKLSDEWSCYINVVGDKIYYSNDSGIYSIGTNGADRQKLSDDVSEDINVVDNRIYYRNLSDNFSIYSMNTDGTDKCKLNDEESFAINVMDGRIYYSAPISTFTFYSMSSDGTDISMVGDNCVLHTNVVDNKVYYCNLLNGMKLYSMNTDGTDRHKLNDDVSLFVNVVGGRVFYVNGSDADRLYSINTDGTDCRIVE